MKRMWLIAAFAVWIVLHPSAKEAEARVYVTVSVGGMIFFGAGAIFWGVSYSTRVSGLNTPASENRSKALFSKQDAGWLTATGTSGSMTEPGPEPINTARHAMELQVPLFVYRW